MIKFGSFVRTACLGRGIKTIKGVDFQGNNIQVYSFITRMHAYQFWQHYRFNSPIGANALSMLMMVVAKLA